DIVHVANVMCLILGFGLGADGLQHNISEEALERFNLKDKVEELLSEAVNILYQLDEEMKTEEIV
ncbi:MAG: HDOD domain-containing protein, partial [Acetomicrobium sp.]